ncbi:MAG: hypothetical protein WCJ25_00305 [Candidatus Moraniibacteriota bacterium]
MKVLKNNLSEKELQELTKRAFLFVVSGKNAFKFQKRKALDDIISHCPDAVDSIGDQEMYESFRSFCEESARRGEVVSPAELDWVSKYISDSDIRRDIEKLIYRILLCASSYWEKVRESPKFTITQAEKTELARQVLQSYDVGSVRQAELARELGVPAEEYILSHYKKLLYDRHFDEAEELKVNNPQAVLEVVVKNIENHYLSDALEVLLRFLPEREDLAEEVRQMKVAFSSE